MQDVEIDFTKLPDLEIVDFIVDDLTRFHENPAEAEEKKSGMIKDLADGAYFERSSHGFALVIPPGGTRKRKYAVLNYLYSCEPKRGHGSALIEQVKKVCAKNDWPGVALRCYTDELKDFYAKRGFDLFDDDGGYTMDWLPERGH